MQDLFSLVEALRRPPLLVSAARFGVDDYSRERMLPRLLRCATAPRTGEAVVQLLELEEDHDGRRRAGAAEYSVARHVEVLIALMAETRLLRASGPQPVR
ncbi:DUF6477 family protein [Histidinibacterium aquaticum]|uniref:Uncharacterized protein n=1 Tax=Histidinibacterium aquaticum TaxID=2613962 RepID=A0A5J5GNA8_9RHOB|nr:DUF6477 family protein [Histidinibacterium aquaticum]KAA9009213.1 hypothetical protein F3S47_08140 [Histidinibacterium aquaticum]